MKSIGEWWVVRRLPSRRRVLHEAIHGREPWRRAALAIERGDAGRRELRAMADAARRLDHPGIARLVEDGSDAPEPRVALAWCDGRRLDAVSAALAAPQRLDVAVQIAELVAHAHARGVVLRDLKPGNLLVAPGQARVTLVDLDLARFGRPEPGRPAGTWRWTAPEQAVLDGSEIDARADVYALGTTLYFVFAGQPLFSEGPRAIVEQLAGARVAECEARLPAAIGPIVRACLALDRRERITAEAVALRLRGLPVSPVADASPRRAPTSIAAPATRDAAIAARPAAADVAMAALAELIAALEAGRGLAAAEAHLRVHDPARAAALAAEALALDPDEPRALACLARAQVEIGAPADAARTLDRLDELPAADALDEPRRARVIEAELLAHRPARALEWAHRAPRSERVRALEQFAALAREWLREVDRLDDDARLAWGASAARTGLSAQVRRSLGAALILLGRRGDDDAVAAIAELRTALADERTAPGVPLDDLAARGANAAPLCAALLLHLEGLDDAALAVPLDDALDAARIALLAGRPDDARRRLERAPPGPGLGTHVRALTLLDGGHPGAAIDLLWAAHATDATAQTKRWLCHALLRAGRAAEALAILDSAPAPDPLAGRAPGTIASREATPASSERTGRATSAHANREAGSSPTQRGELAGAPPALDALVAPPRRRAAWFDRMRIAALVAAGQHGDAIAACDAAGTADAVAALARAIAAELDRRDPGAAGWQDVPRVRAAVRAGLAAERFELVRAVHAAVGTLETLDLWIATCRARGTAEAAGEALAACRSALDDHPCAEHALRLIDALGAAGEHIEAAQILATWLSRAPDVAALWCAAAHALLAARDWGEAIAAAERARTFEPHNRDAAASAMIAWLERGEPARAAALAREAVAAWPRGELAWEVLLEAEQALDGNPGAAIAGTRDALRACPGSARLLRRLGAALASAGQLDDALAVHAEALAAEPRSPALWADRAQLLLATGRAAEALHAARALERIAGPSPEVGAIRLWAWMALGEPALAIEAGTAVVAADAAGPALWEGLALAWLATGAVTDARNALEMMQRAGGRADRGARLALLVALAGDVSGDVVRAIADDAVALDPRDRDLAFMAAIARLSFDDTGAALRAFDELLRGAPDWVPGLHIAIATAATGPRAASAIDRALHDHLATAPQAVGWAGATWLIARGRPAEAALLAHRAASLAAEQDDGERTAIDRQALGLVAAEAALRAGDERGLRAAAESLGPTARTELAAQLARRLAERTRTVSSG